MTRQRLLRVMCASSVVVLAAAFAIPIITAGAAEEATPITTELIDMTDHAMLAARKPLLIAHRGGVIAPNAPECSLAAVRLAAAHGYDMVELDVQETKDAQPVVFHDPTLLRASRRNQTIRDLTMQEAAAISYRASDQRIATLDAALALCKSLKLGVMLDIKTVDARPASEAFFRRIGELLQQHQLTHAAITFSKHPLARKHLAGKACFAVTKDDFQKVQRGEAVQLQGQFWFGQPQELPTEIVARLQRSGALVIPAINTFRYPRQTHRDLAARDIARLLAAGVDGFQIDSVYEDLFPRR